MKISVTQEHIKNGKPLMPGCCAIALAIKEQGPSDALYVLSDGLVEFIALAKTVCLPTLAYAKMKAFDEGVNIEPFEFELDI
jgi:hypothetical protein